MLQGTITLKDGTGIELNDGKLVRDGLEISMSTSSGGRFDIGTFNAAELHISIYDEEAAGHEFDGAKIALSEKTETEDGETRIDPLGTYYADGTKTDRRSKIVKLTAYDGATLFDTAIGEADKIPGYTVRNVITRACEAVGVLFDSASFGGDFPNASAAGLTLTPDEVQTWRDAVMWCAQLLCANALVSADGKLRLCRARYLSSGETIQIDHEISGDRRKSIRFSDVRTYIKYLTAYEAEGKTADYTSSYISDDAQARPAEFLLPENPLLKFKTKDEMRAVNSEWLLYIDGFKQQEIKAGLLGNPKIRLGDTCRFSGGTIDVRRSIIGVVTDIRRKYNGIITVICHAPEAAVWEGENQE